MVNISDKTSVAMPIKNMVGIIVAVATGVWAYFGIVERLNNVETSQKLMSADFRRWIEFSIKWPRGELGSLPADSEQFMLIEYMSKQVEKIQKELDESRHNAVNIQRLQTDMEKAINDIEKLKDKIRENGNK
jgi:methylthioribose-1-phosphate isomerase